MTKNKTPRRPSIFLIDSEADALSDLALTIEARSPQISELLLDEISRANIKPRDKLPHNVVTMNSTVEFIDQAEGRTYTMQLVYPSRADIAEGRISILSLVGAGLIGLRTGQAILWPDRAGQKRTLSIVRVTQPDLEAAH